MENLLYIRGAERLFIVASGLISLILGYALFRLTYPRGSRSEAELVAKGGGFELTLRNAWPGVFFAAFGMIILVASVITQIVVTPTATHATGAVQSVTFGMPVLPPEENKTRAMNAMRAISEVLRADLESADKVTPQRTARIEALGEALLGLVDVAQGEGSLNRYYDLKSKAKTPAEFDKVSAKDRVFFENLRSIMER